MTKKTESKKKQKKLGMKKGHKLTLRLTQLDDYQDIKEIMDLVYTGSLGGAWTWEQFQSQVKTFPEGQLCIEDNGKVIAAAITLIVNYGDFGDKHNYNQITGNGYLTTHSYDGDTLYGVDIFVHPDYRNMRLGRRLYDARKELCERFNLRRIVAGGRIPGYGKHLNKLTPGRYIELVKKKELRDPILSFQLANDFHVRKVITNYLPEDKDSHAYATLIEWINIHYLESESSPDWLGSGKQIVRVGAVQWQMRPVKSLEELKEQMEYFVDTVAGYKSDICLFPEFFSAPLMALSADPNPAIAIRHLAEHTEALREEMVRLAINYNVNIIAGSMPVYQDQRLHNVSYLCRRDGSWDMQYKIHITPDETDYWGLIGGNKVRVFETDIGRIGILICYDIEFPELSRLLAEDGLNILFVPYWTDNKNAYQRVRICAHARAIENECYVVISGSVGNLPNVENMDIQYSQAMIFSPSDFAFPHDAIVSEATPNTEMTLLADLDLGSLKQLRERGSVRNHLDRRLDLYRLSWVEPS
jgi:predicted amidohydrolase/GNAT superfamily N-acetyltransferase